ncbi:MAG: VOC family protein [Cyclobacteriaceae bacterium]
MNLEYKLRLKKIKTATFLIFVGEQCGKAQEAINFYTSIFPNSEVEHIIKYREGEAGGTPDLIKFGIFTLNGIHSF